jgi:chromosome segregation ATPase
VDDFAALEDRIRRAVELVKSERQARAAAEERAVTAEAQVRMQEPLMDQLHNEINALRAERDSLHAERDGMRAERDNLHAERDGLHAERDQVRQRVERLLSQLDALEL